MGLLLLQGASDLNPRELFAGGEQGLWLDPSQMSTLYQDSNGVTPCTAAGDPVGLILDQSRGGLGALGPELVTNGDFSSGTTGWSAWNANAQMSVSNGQMTITQPVGGNQVGVGPSVGYTTVVGRTYIVSLDLISISNGGSGPQLRIGSFNGGVDNTSFFLNSGLGRQSGVFRANATTTFVNVAVQSTAGSTLTIDNISVREVPGNHAYQSTSGQRPTLARIPASGRRNLLTRTEELSNAAWSTGASNLGTRTNGSVSVSNAEGYVYIKQFGSFSDSVDHVLSFDVTCDQSITDVPIRAAGTVSVSQLVTLSAGVATRVTLTGYRPSGGGSPNIEVGIDARNAIVPGGSNSTGYTVTFNRVQLETGSSATNYQKVVATTDVTESGFADLWHLVFDGSDDSLVTNSIDFTATDEMTVIAGVRKLSDAATQMILELSANVGSNSGSFYLTAAELTGASGNFSFKTRGDVNPAAYANSGTILAPATRVISGLGDISSDAASIRINSTQTDYSADQGSGNFGNHILYIGRRGGSSLPYNGHLYQLIIRGKTTPTGKLLEAERFVGRKTGVSF